MPCSTVDHGEKTGALAAGTPAGSRRVAGMVVVLVSSLVNSLNSLSLTSMSINREHVRVMALKPEGPDCSVRGAWS